MAPRALILLVQARFAAALAAPPAAGILLFAAACATEPHGGVSTGSTCPAPPVTYADFAQAFMSTYCLACHSQTRTGAERHRAPATVDFDTQSLVRMWTSHIDRQAAFGPESENALMPPSGSPMPSRAERLLLGEYIACEVGR